MEAKQIRCISIKPDKKTGEYQVRYLSEKVVNNPFFMRKYGWKVEEVKAEKEQYHVCEIKPKFCNAVIETPEIEVPKTEAPVKPKATRAKRKTTKK